MTRTGTNATDARVEAAADAIAEFRRLSGQMGRDTDWDDDEELRLFATLPPDERADVVARLRIVLRHRDLDVRETAVATSAALGLTTPNFYRILRRMDQVGPLRALARRHAAPRASTRGGGFDPVVEGWIGEVLEGEPDAGIAAVARILARRAWALPESDRPSLPGESALRRRVHDLRRRGDGGTAASTPVGAELLLDRCRIDAVVDGVGPLWLTALVDLPTRALCGCWVGGDGRDGGLPGLLGDVEIRLPGLAHAGVRIAPRMLSLEWVVPDGLTDAAQAVGSDLPAGRRPRIELHDAGRRRMGVRLTRLLSDRFGPFRLLARPEAVSADRLTVLPETFEAYALLDEHAGRWNAEALAARSVVGGRGRRAMDAAARDVADDLRVAFGPVADQARGMPSG